jgi:hypothetical protein
MIRMTGMITHAKVVSARTGATTIGIVSEGTKRSVGPSTAGVVSVNVPSTIQANLGIAVRNFGMNGDGVLSKI